MPALWTCVLCKEFAWYPGNDWTSYLCTNCGAVVPVPEVRVSCTCCHEEFTFDPILNEAQGTEPCCGECVALSIEKLIATTVGKEQIH